MKGGYQLIKIPITVICNQNRIAILVLLFITYSFSATYSQDSELPIRWTDNTALLMPVKKWETGVLQTFRYSLKKKVELRTNALIMPVLPNAGVRISLISDKKISLSSEHTISYPTLFLNTLSFKGTGGLISPQFSIPFIVTLSNSLIATAPIGTTTLISGETGITLALRGNKPDYISSVDIPFIYQRMAHYYEGASIKTGMSVIGKLSKNIEYEECLRLYLITRKNDNIFIENSGAVLLRTRKFCRIKVGYLLSWGDYPFGNHLQVWPAFDIIFGPG